MMLMENSGQEEIARRFSEFAEKHVSGHTEVLQQASRIPPELWTAMRASGLFGLNLPEAFGGQGRGTRALLAAGRALVESGGNMGIALSWLIHELTARYLILPFGTPEQHHGWLPDLAAGVQTACFAVSEPEAGAHPKRLKTSADRDGDDYVLNGAKTYLTNGPMADLFIVIAVTASEGKRNRFSAFLIPRETPGLSVSEPMPIDVLRPAPHGSLSLADCRVPSLQMLGPVDGAYESMVLKFREIEDTLMAGPLLGGMAYALTRICEATELTESVKEDIFDAHIDLCGLWEIAQKTAVMLEKGADPERRDDLNLYFEKHTAEMLYRIKAIAGRSGADSDNRFSAMAADLTAMLRIGQSAAAARKRKRCARWFEQN